MKRFLLALASCGVLVPAQGFAQSAKFREPAHDQVVVAHDVGLRVSVAPGIFIPTNGGDVGFSFAGDVRYGFPLGPVVLAPGGRLAGYFPPGFATLTVLGTARLAVPIGPVAAYGIAGVGPGYVTDPSHVGFAYMAGGGAEVPIKGAWAIGAEGTYFRIIGSHFRSVFIGPTLSFRI